jgi:hypothetical protein
MVRSAQPAHGSTRDPLRSPTAFAIPAVGLLILSTAAAHGSQLQHVLVSVLIAGIGPAGVPRGQSVRSRSAAMQKAEGSSPLSRLRAVPVLSRVCVFQPPAAIAPDA